MRARHKNMKTRLLSVALIILLSPVVALAGWSCGIDASLLPHVYAIEVRDGHLEAYVGPLERGDNARVSVGSAIRLEQDGEWSSRSRMNLPDRSDSAAGQSCMEPRQDTEWLQAHRPAALNNPYFEQNVSVCTSAAGKRWGGISFYGGEGYWGLGGIVEEDLASGDFRVFRDHSLNDVSASHLAYFGEHLWVGTVRHGECGSGIGVGVVFGYFANDTFYAVPDRNTCGFAVSDMLVHEDALWIATEMGLSKATKSKERFTNFDWTHYVPTGNASRPMRETSCEDLYGEVLRSPELAAASPNDDGHPYGVLWGRISTLRPGFAWQYVRKLNELAPQPDPENSE